MRWLGGHRSGVLGFFSWESLFHNFDVLFAQCFNLPDFPGFFFKYEKVNKPDFLLVENFTNNSYRTPPYIDTYLQLFSNAYYVYFVLIYTFNYFSTLENNEYYMFHALISTPHSPPLYSIPKKIPLPSCLHSSRVANWWCHDFPPFRLTTPPLKSYKGRK